MLVKLAVTCVATFKSRWRFDVGALYLAQVVITLNGDLVETASLGCFRLQPKVFQNSVLRIIFRYKIWEVGGGWRELHNEKLLPLE
jgi:hypothetical protein